MIQSSRLIHKYIIFVKPKRHNFYQAFQQHYINFMLKVHTYYTLQYLSFCQDPEKRSQLWRMAASRRLVHIESSTTGSTNMVLDIEGGRLPSKGGLVSLVLQRESSARIQSQAWRFTEVSTCHLQN